MAVLVYTLTNSLYRFPFPYTYTSICFYLCSSNLKVVLIFLFLKAKYAEHVLKGLLAICISFENFLYSSIAQFLPGLLIFLMVSILCSFVCSRHHVTCIAGRSLLFCGLCLHLESLLLHWNILRTSLLSSLPMLLKSYSELWVCLLISGSISPHFFSNFQGIRSSSFWSIWAWIMFRVRNRNYLFTHLVAFWSPNFQYCLLKRLSFLWCTLISTFGEEVVALGIEPRLLIF